MSSCRVASIVICIYLQKYTITYTVTDAFIPMDMNILISIWMDAATITLSIHIWNTNECYFFSSIFQKCIYFSSFIEQSTAYMYVTITSIDYNKFIFRNLVAVYSCFDDFILKIQRCCMLEVILLFIEIAWINSKVRNTLI